MIEAVVRQDPLLTCSDVLLQGQKKSSKEKGPPQKAPNAPSKTKGGKSTKRNKQAGNARQIEEEEVEAEPPSTNEDFSFGTSKSGPGHDPLIFCIIREESSWVIKQEHFFAEYCRLSHLHFQMRETHVSVSRQVQLQLNEEKLKQNEAQREHLRCQLSWVQ